MKRTATRKIISKKTYHDEVIIKPAERLLRALQNARAAKSQAKLKVQKTATSR